MLRWRPQEVAFVGTCPQPAWELQALLPEKADGLDGASGPLEHLEDQPNGALHLGVGIEADCTVSSIDQSDRWPHLQLAAPGLVELTTTHARFENMQFGLAHGAFEAEQEAIIEAGRIIDTVFVENERRSQRAQFDETMPVRGVARQSRDLQAHDDAGFAKRHLAHELLKAVACGAAGTRLAEIAIDHMNALDRPARYNCALAQRILALRALAMFGDLPQRGLANIQVRITLEMVGRDLELRHASAP